MFRASSERSTLVERVSHWYCVFHSSLLGWALRPAFMNGGLFCSLRRVLQGQNSAIPLDSCGVSY